jgi:hypothetical protein
MAARVCSIACTTWVCMENICSTDIGVSWEVAAGDEAPPPAGHSAPARHASLLGACCHTSVEGIYTSVLISQSFRIEKDNKILHYTE